MKSGGGNFKAPADVEPQGGSAPYGQASAFSPQYQSFLPQDGAIAQLGDSPRMEGGIITPLQQQQEAIIAAQALQAAQPAAAARPSPREQFLQMLMEEQRQRKSPGGLGGGSGGGFSHGDRGASYGGRSGKGGLY